MNGEFFIAPRMLFAKGIFYSRELLVSNLSGDIS